MSDDSHKADADSITRRQLENALSAYRMRTIQLQNQLAMHELKTQSRLARLKHKLFVLVPLIPLAFGFWLALLSAQDLREKDAIQTSIATAASNGATLEDVKSIYRNWANSAARLTMVLKPDADTYSRDVPLSTVLQDIRANAYLEGTPDSTLLTTIGSLIAEHELVDPFDRLEGRQKVYFHNTRHKLGEQYSRVQSDIGSIAEELSGRNQLVTDYLNHSRTSFWVSISALVAALLAIGLQMYQNRSSRLRSLFADVLPMPIEGEKADPD